jgi:hypothetical protein
MTDWRRATGDYGSEYFDVDSGLVRLEFTDNPPVYLHPTRHEHNHNNSKQKTHSNK